MRFNILGPVRVVDGTSSLNIGGPKQRAVLAVLVANIGRPLTADQLAEAVYSEDSSGRVRRRIQTYVSTLRSVVGDVIVKDGSAWSLVVDRAAVDALRFEDLVQSAGDLPPADCSEVLREALALWRGHPYADIEAHGLLDAETARLIELRVGAQQARIDADLESGRHSDLIGEIEGLLAEHPYRERFRAQHMLALYRAGRQREALRSYGQMRSVLLDELGVDPTPELQGLEEKILRQEKSLLLPAPRSIQKRAVLVADPGGPLELARLPAAEREYRLSRSEAALRAAVRETNGGPIHPAGTATYVVFDTADQATAAAEATNRRLDGSGMRIAIDWGDIEVSEGGVSGPPVSRAAVLVAVAHPGQVVLSTEAQQEIISEGVGPGLRFESLGSHDMPGIEKAVPIYQLLVGDPPQTFPPLVTDRVPPPLPEGGHRSVPGYELREPVGVGSIGTLYRAYQPSVGREVIMEVIGRSESSDPDFIRSFEADAQRLAMLDHPSINSVLDYWRDTDGAYLVYRNHRGGFLANLSTAAPQVLAQIGSALAYAHSYGMVHGSLRPDRIILDESGNAYLMGFPIGGVAPVSSPQHPAYIAPETLAGRAPSVATDVYALGVLAYELESGPVAEDEALTPKSPVLARAVSGDPALRHESVVSLLEELVPATEESSASRFTETRNPYKGLAAFNENDASDFFGRAQVVDELVDALRGSDFLAVVGPSGIGKSSVVRAGLIPALRKGSIDGSDTWVVTDMLPGSHPFLELQRALERVAVDLPVEFRNRFADRDPNALANLGPVLPENSELLVVIDQFEELFTMSDEAVAAAFLDLLVTAAGSGQARVVITLRADFLDRPLLYSSFGELLGEGMVTLRAPNKAELAEAIESPVEAMGVNVEAALVERIVSDVHDRPSALPLLQHALSEMFQSRTSDLLTTDSYEEIGGVTGSITKRAEATFEALDPQEQTLAKQLLLRLVAVSGDNAPTRRRVKVSALGGSATAHVIEAFARDRLVVYDSDPDTRAPTAEVAHEALLTRWPRLATWIEAAREDLTLARRLEESRADWETNDRGEGYLLTGGRLAQHQAWTDDTSLTLTQAETGFLAESAAHDGKLKARRRHRRNWIMSGFAVAASVATILGLVAWSNARTADEKSEQAQQNAQDARNARAEAQTERDQAVEAWDQAEVARNQADVARNQSDSLRVVADAQRLMANATGVMDEDPDLALLLATYAGQDLEGDPKALGVLRQAYGDSRTTFTTDEPHSSVATLSPDGQSFVMTIENEVGATEVSARNSETGEALWHYTIDIPEGSESFPTAIYVSGGAEVAVAVLWLPQDGLEDSSPPEAAGLHILDSETGERLRHFSFGCGVTVWGDNVAGSQLPLMLLDTDQIAEQGCPANLTGGMVGQVHLVDLETGEADPVGPVADFGRPLRPQIAFNEQGNRRLIYDPAPGEAGAGPTIVVEDASSGERLVTIPDAPQAWTAAISPDGELAVVGGSNDSGIETLFVYSVETGDEVARLSGHVGGTNQLEFISGGSLLLTIGLDGLLKVWDPGAGILVESIALGGDFWAMSVSDNGRKVLVAGSVTTVLSLDPADNVEVGLVDGCPGTSTWNLRSGLVVRDDQLLTTVWCDGQSALLGRVFDLATLEPIGDAPFSFSQGIDLSPDGRFVASQEWIPSVIDGGPDIVGTVLVTDLTTRARTEMEGLCRWSGPGGSGPYEGESCVLPPSEPLGAEANDLTFSPDGTILAMGSATAGRVWDTTTGEILGRWPFFDVTFSPDGSRIVTFDDETQVMEVRDTANFDVLARNALTEGDPRPWSLRVTLDGSMVVGKAGVDVYFYDIDTLENVRVLSNLHESSILDLELSVDGSMIATASTDGFARVWDLDTGELLHEIPASSTDKVQAVEFADNDTHLVVSVANSPTRIYTLEANELLEMARSKLVRGFTERECDDYFRDSACPTLEEMRAS